MATLPWAQPTTKERSLHRGRAKASATWSLCMKADSRWRAPGCANGPSPMKYRKHFLSEERDSDVIWIRNRESRRSICAAGQSCAKPADNVCLFHEIVLLNLPIAKRTLTSTIVTCTLTSIGFRRVSRVNDDSSANLTFLYLLCTFVDTWPSRLDSFNKRTLWFISATVVYLVNVFISIMSSLILLVYSSDQNSMRIFSHNCRDRLSYTCVAMRQNRYPSMLNHIVTNAFGVKWRQRNWRRRERCGMEDQST